MKGKRVVPALVAALMLSSVAANATARSVSIPSFEQPFRLGDGYEQVPILHAGSDAAFQLPERLTLNETGPDAGRYLYRTHGANGNAGVTVTDLLGKDPVRVLAQRADWDRFDTLTWTPWGTLLAGETAGQGVRPDPAVPEAKNGLVYELNPVTGAAVPRPAMGSLAFAGITMDAAGNVYAVDENREGGIYRFVPARPGDLSTGQLYVMRLTRGRDSKRASAEWVPVPADRARADARGVAREVGAARYARPADAKYHDGVLYVAVADENRVIAVDLRSERPVVTDFIGTGQAKDGEFANPAALAFNSDGLLFVAEQRALSDIWAARPDSNGDGRSDGVERFATLLDPVARPAGIYFDPVGFFARSHSQNLFVNVQHTADGKDKTFVMRKQPNPGGTLRTARWLNAGTPDNGAQAPILMAHRGAIRLAPENTVDAYRDAFAMGATMVEIDARQTKDGRYVSFHDSTVDRVAGGPGAVADMTFDQLRALNVANYAPWKGSTYDPAQVASLDEILQIAHQAGGGMEIDIKNVADPGDLANQVAKYPDVFARTVFSTKDARLKAAQPDAKLIYDRNQYETAGMIYLQGSYYYAYGSRLDEFSAESIIAVHDAGGVVLPHAYDDGDAREGQSFMAGRNLGTDGAETNQLDAVMAAAGLHAPTAIELVSSGEGVLARLYNPNNRFGLPQKELVFTLDGGTQRLVTGRDGKVSIPAGWEKAAIRFDGDAATAPSTLSRP